MPSIAPTSALLLPLLTTLVSAHGYIASPPARMPGAKMEAACGAQVFNNQQADHYGNVQGELQIAESQSDYKAAACDVWLCKGFKLEDASSSDVQSYAPGQTVSMEIEIRAPHTGSANVSIVDTATNTIIGTPLKSWDVYASNSSPIPDAQTSFEVTIPSGIDASRCAAAGDCVLQWYWDAPDIDQTYEACVDFTLSGSGSGSETGTETGTETGGETEEEEEQTGGETDGGSCSSVKRAHARDFI